MQRLLILSLIVLSATLSTAAPARADDVRALVSGLLRVMDAPDGGASRQERQAFEQTVRDAYAVKSLAQLDGRVSIALLTGTSLGGELAYLSFGGETLRADSAASAIKAAVLVYYQHLLERDAALAGKVVVGRTLADHAQRMVRNSDNASANALMDDLGMEAINGWYESLGFPPGELRLRRHFSGNPSADPGAKDNHASARALTLLYFLIAQPESVDGFLSAASLKQVRWMLMDMPGHPNTLPQFNDRLNGLIKPPGYVFVHKTGSNTEVIVDAGILYNGKQSFIMVAFDTKLKKPAMQRLGLNLLRLMKQRAAASAH